MRICGESQTDCLDARIHGHNLERLRGGGNPAKNFQAA